MRRLPALLLLVLLLPAAAKARTSHQGWPVINGAVLMNKRDGSRPLDARPGQDPFGGQDPRYSCDQIHERGTCHGRFDAAASGRTMTVRVGHNELLGGHGSDVIHAGPWGDVIWGDYKPSGQPTSQRDRLSGGAGRDFIYASHGWNLISARGGNDVVKAHYGHGVIKCGAGDDVLYVSRRAQKGYDIRGCETISHKTTGY
jgi:Ca2+-binding RTX toxin-like protein